MLFNSSESSQLLQSSEPEAYSLLFKKELTSRDVQAILAPKQDFLPVQIRKFEK